MIEGSSLPRLSDTEFRVFYRPHDKPLETFYIPALSAAVHYDRSAGYFRSSALAVAAAGIVRLIANNGRMRLLVGAELSQADVEAIRAGYDMRAIVGDALAAELPDNMQLDGPLQQRLNALAWMVARGTLDIKVVLPLDDQGFPVPGSQAQEYYHPKKGIFTDAEGNQVGFVGSVNESAQAWQRNFEEFSVYCSWEGKRDQEALAQLRISFNDLWDGRDPHWVALDLPDAVRQTLIRMAPKDQPTRDPFEPQPTAVVHDGRGGFAAATQEERLRFQFLRDAPYLLHAQDLGAATSAVTPWPHQLQVARELTERFPDRALLCDEVGLGKTIEAGLVIRQLIISGRVKRCLILAPAAVARQWQEELYEKFNLRLPRYDKNQLYDLEGQPMGPPTTDPWDEQNFLIATSHLARRKERVPQLLAARPWDLLVVDEAHHARRKDFLQPQYRPNRLLTLLNELKQEEQYEGLFLLTATPMQVHPVEVWDLLTVLGLGGRWGADENNFLGFFEELRRDFRDTEWEFVFDMVADHQQNGAGDGEIDPHFYNTMQRKLGTPRANAIKDLPRQSGHRASLVKGMPADARPYVQEMARRHTPLQHYLFRSTRTLLREYAAKGLLDANVPTRRPTIQRISFLTDEEALYLRITEYISEFYARYEAERRGLGFIMTVYRRRLTSSFYAVCRSLERRRDWLLGQVEVGEVFTAEDEADLDELDQLEQAGLDLNGMDPQAPVSPGQAAAFQAELDYLDSFIADLQTLSQGDSKINQLKDDLDRVFRERGTVLVFTQYTDTMDYLREQLNTVYRGQIACYSGRGGEIWQGMTWLPTTKEFVKNEFRDGRIKILLCTESASEGLNLQTCGVLINYDMPWNPMRVEQRIGRIDRIGQQYDEVWIYNYFYRDTIEDRVYQALRDRINWFEAVVGTLQPILAEVNKITRELAMLPAERQEFEFNEAMHRLQEEIDREQLAALNLDEYLQHEEPHQGLETPVTLDGLQQVLTQSSATAHLFRPHETIPDAFRLTWRSDNNTAVTFNAKQFENYPSTLLFMSYGNPTLQSLLEAVPQPEAYPGYLVRFEADVNWPIRGWYDLRGHTPRPLNTLDDLQSALDGAETAVAGDLEGQAETAFGQETGASYAAYERRKAQLVHGRQAILQAQARRLLEKGALVKIALGRKRSLFDTGGYPTGFNHAAVTGLVTHGNEWAWMLHIVGNQNHQSLPVPSPSDSYYEEIRDLESKLLKARFDELSREATAVAKTWNQLTQEGG